MDDITLPAIERLELTSIIRRLEAATSRLEDIATSTIEVPKTNGSAPPTPAPTGPLPQAPVPAALAPESEIQFTPVLPQCVEEFDAFINGPLVKFVNISDELGGPVAEQVCDNGRTSLDNLADDELGVKCIAGVCSTAKIHPHNHQGKEA
jgi:adenylyl cyclase-associated protein